MNFLIVGAGYTGISVIKNLPQGNITYISRSKKKTLNCNYHTIDLDDYASSSIQISSPYALLYTVPPNPNEDEDSRLAHLLEIISSKTIWSEGTGILALVEYKPEASVV